MAYKSWLNCYTINCIVYRDKETSILTEQIDKLKKAIKKEVDKAKDLETKARYDSRRLHKDVSLFVFIIYYQISKKVFDKAKLPSIR